MPADSKVLTTLFADEGMSIAGAIDKLFPDAHESGTGRVPEPSDWNGLQSKACRVIWRS